MTAIMSEEERRYVCFHEAGHAAMVYWRREFLHGRRIVIHTDRFGGSTVVPVYDGTESDLMVLLGGPMAELLSEGIVAVIAIRFANEYRLPNSDTTRIRKLVRMLRGGKDDKKYQFAVQERVRAIIQEPTMWKAITALAERLEAEGEINGEDAEAIFEGLGVQDRFGARPAR